ncbi:hypothetical protein BDQ12DRAFT_756654 [Crucibulum laeve]|uniref:Uncharacterized protein n=1 Tax=Crucibulum laeve TaxID=68775 RepID=A0A5C3LR05_9AGAR|nr:hypothetical protein BDQ12DRAFT_756654 [Crucibulum laeve]
MTLAGKLTYAAIAGIFRGPTRTDLNLVNPPINECNTRTQQLPPEHTSPAKTLEVTSPGNIDSFIQKDEGKYNERPTEAQFHEHSVGRGQDRNRILQDKVHSLSRQLALAEKNHQSDNRRLVSELNGIRDAYCTGKRQKEWLESHLRQQTIELDAVKQQVRILYTEHAQTTQLLESRTKELKAAQLFLTKTDEYSESELIHMVESLNSEIFQAAAILSESLGLEYISAGANIEVTESMGNVLGKPLVCILLQMKAHVTQDIDTLPVQVALQVIMITACMQIVHSWTLLDDHRYEGFMSSLYSKIQDSGDQAVSGRWRALTRAQFKHSNSTVKDLSFKIQNDIFAVLSLCGYSPTSSTLKDHLEAFYERLIIIIKGAFDLRTAIEEGMASTDLNLIAATAGMSFKVEWMDDAYADIKGTGTISAKEKVACTIDMGLQRNLFQSKTTLVLNERTILLRPKVVLVSVLGEAIPSAQ